MSGHRKFAELAARVRSLPGAAEDVAELHRKALREGEAYRQTLAEIRKARAVTQVELSRELAVSQAQVSRIESQGDPYLSTLARYLLGIGAELEITAVFADGTRVLLNLAEAAGQPDAIVETPDVATEALTELVEESRREREAVAA